MHSLKKKARNKARVEGSIVEAYIVEEISNFCSEYFKSSVRTKFNQVPRNDDGGGGDPKGRLSICCYPSYPFGNCGNRELKDDELRIIELYVLLNCEEIEPYVQ